MWFWASTEKMTVGFEVLPNETVGECAPIISKFKGQPWTNLTAWLERQDGYLLERTDRLEVPGPTRRPCDNCGCPQPPHRCFCSMCHRFTHDRRWRMELANEANEIPYRNGKNVATLWPELTGEWAIRDTKTGQVRTIK